MNLPDLQQSPVERAPERGLNSPVGILAILAIINFLNYVDRFVLAPLVEQLQRPVALGGLALSSKQVGLLATAFMLVHSAFSVPLGVLADRWRRSRVIAGGVALWSIATAAAGLATSFGGLFASRAAVGIGEASYAPAASALVSDRFPPELRARALGVFQLGMVLGSAAGIIAGGVVAAYFGWRAAFFVVGAPGLLLAGLVLLVRERVRPPHVRQKTSLRGFRPSSALIWVNISAILVTFAAGAIMFWGPAFILRYHYPGQTNALRTASITFGLIACVAGAAGTLVGSYLGDRLERRMPGSGRLLTVASGLFLSAPFAALGFLVSSTHVLYVSLALGVFFSVWFAGPILATLHDLVPVDLRATATGVYLLLIHLLGDAISPPLVGLVDDLTGSLRAGLLCALGALVLGGVAALAAIPGAKRAVRLKRDGGAG